MPHDSLLHSLSASAGSKSAPKPAAARVPEVGDDWCLGIRVSNRRERRTDLSPQESLMPDFSPTGADARANSGEYSLLCTRQFESGVPSHTVGLCALARPDAT